MAMNKDIVKKLHREVNEALAAVAKSNGFVFNPGNFTYSDLDVRGKMTFVKSDKQVEYSDRNTISSRPSLGLAVGDTIVLGMNTTQYKISSFGQRGCINVERVSDGKMFRVPGKSVGSVKRVDFKGVAAEAQPNITVVGIKKAGEAEIIKKIADVYNSLSPENLSCDGELPMREVSRRRVHLNRELRDLFVQLGREISETEAYDLDEQNRKAGLV